MVQWRAKYLCDTSGRLQPALLGSLRGSLGSDSSSSPIYTLRASTEKDDLWPPLLSLKVPGRGEATLHPSSPLAKPRTYYPCIWGSCASQAFPWAPWAQKAAAKCHSLAVIIPGRQSIRALSILASASIAASNDLTSGRGLPVQTDTAMPKHRSHLHGSPGGDKLSGESCVRQSLLRGLVLTQVKLLALPASVPGYHSPSSPLAVVCASDCSDAKHMGASASLTGLAFPGSAAGLGDTSS